MTGEEAERIEEAWSERHDHARIGQLATTSFGMVLLLTERGQRDEALELLREMAGERIQRAEATGIGQVKVHAGPYACPACRAQDGQVFTLEEARRLMPVPHTGCTSHYGYCRCLVLAWRPEWEEGRAEREARARESQARWEAEWREEAARREQAAREKREAERPAREAAAKARRAAEREALRQWKARQPPDDE